MPIDLKPYYDAANQAEVEVQMLINDIDTAFNLGTEEGTNKALGLRESLAAAQANAKAANELYITLKNASSGQNVVSNFVPISDTPTDPDEEEESQPTSMSLAQYRNLSPSERLVFAKGSGTLVE